MWNVYKKREEFLLKRHKCLSEECDFEENALLERRFFYALIRKMRKITKK